MREALRYVLEFEQGHGSPESESGIASSLMLLVVEPVVLGGVVVKPPPDDAVESYYYQHHRHQAKQNHHAIAADIGSLVEQRAKPGNVVVLALVYKPFGQYQRVPSPTPGGDAAGYQRRNQRGDDELGPSLRAAKTVCPRRFL